MKISVITVCKNAAQHIKTAIKSVISQTYDDVEYIIVDGDSQDRTKEIITRHQDSISHFVSEPDTGIYAAMNKGIRMATGSFIYFLNSDDYLLDENVLRDVAEFIEDHPDSDVVYGNLRIQVDDNKTQVIKPPLPNKIAEWMMFGSMPHQATFAKIDLFKRYGFFNEQRQVVGDVEWYLNLLKYPEINWYYVSRTIAAYNLHGLSAKDVRLTRSEFWQVHNSAHIYQGHDLIKQRMLRYQDVVIQLEEQLQHKNQLLAQNKEQLKQVKLQLENCQLRLRKAECKITAMESSKFWRLRQLWFQMKQRVGLSVNE